ncbi:hypothetical protein WDU94_003914 [Cyamophila willieti]
MTLSRCQSAPKKDDKLDPNSTADEKDPILIAPVVENSDCKTDETGKLLLKLEDEKPTSKTLHDIEEEEDDCYPNDDFLSESSSSLTIKRDIRFCQSPSPTLSSTLFKTEKRPKKKGRTRSVTSTTSSDTCGSAGKMQAEQGSIGDLKSYHNRPQERYLRNRRHTLANVR